jgi:uncharacterized protein
LILRVVIDTNVLVSALLFTGGRLGWLRAAWQSESIKLLINKPTTEELLRVLAYPKFKLNTSEQQEILAEALPFAEVVATSKRLPKLPTCRDPFDQIFLELAAAGKADALLTGDLDLLALAGQTKFHILAPEQFRSRHLSSN